MSEGDQFWRYAKEAVLAAYYADSDDEKQKLLDLARTWTQAALVSDVPRSTQAALLSLRKVSHLKLAVASILQFARIDRSVFDESAARVRGEAFDTACAGLRDSNLSPLVWEIVSERIIQAAKWGERDPQRLCRIGIAAMNGERKIGLAASGYAE